VRELGCDISGIFVVFTNAFLWLPYVIGGPLYFCPAVSFYLLFFIPRLISAAADRVPPVFGRAAITLGIDPHF